MHEGPDYRAHEHHYQPASILMQARKHVITEVVMNRPSLVILCGCGDIQNKWVPEPSEDEEGQTVQPPGGILKPHDGEH